MATGKKRRGKDVESWVGKGKNRGEKYKGTWKDGKRSGQGEYTWPDGMRYVGEWKDDEKTGQGVFSWSEGDSYAGNWKDSERSGNGVQWLSTGHVYDGAWAQDNPLQGTAMEPDGALLRFKFDGKTILETENWHKANRVPVGRVLEGRPPPPDKCGGPTPMWEGRVELEDGTTWEGGFCGLRPHGRATVTGRGGVAYVAEYDGKWTIGEIPAHILKQACRAARFYRQSKFPLLWLEFSSGATSRGSEESGRTFCARTAHAHNMGRTLSHPVHIQRTYNACAARALSLLFTGTIVLRTCEVLNLALVAESLQKGGGRGRRRDRSRGRSRSGAGRC
jgi:hypothetical protein